MKQNEEEEAAQREAQAIYMCAVCRKMFRKKGMCPNCDAVLKKKGG